MTLFIKHSLAVFAFATALVSGSFAKAQNSEAQDPITTLATSDRTTGTYQEIVDASQLDASDGDLKLSLIHI